MMLDAFNPHNSQLPLLRLVEALHTSIDRSDLLSPVLLFTIKKPLVHLHRVSKNTSNLGHHPLTPHCTCQLTNKKFTTNEIASMIPTMLTQCPKQMPKRTPIARAKLPCYYSNNKTDALRGLQYRTIFNFLR